MKRRVFNFITATDSYKASHWLFYPKGTQFVRSYLESRVGSKYSEAVMFGLLPILEEHFEGVQITKEKIDAAEFAFHKHFGNEKIFNRAGWEYILNKHEGKLPLRIRAVKEGTVVGVSNVLVTVENTDPNCAWLVNYAETLLVQLWYPITIATRSRNMKKVLMAALRLSGDPAGIGFKLHDFGFRGVSCYDNAAYGGAAHLINFLGTDTFAGIEMLNAYYDGENCATGYPGFSIPATEHSTVTSWGRNGEVAAVKNILEQCQNGLVACVGDSYDMENFARVVVGTELKDIIEKRDGVFVVRPDSGEPTEMVPFVLQILWEQFGGTINDKAFKVLNPKVRVIQGDGIDDESLGKILMAVMAAGFSADNIAFGSGGGLLQKVNRDTMRFAFKCSQIVINGQAFDVYKDPKTDHTKASKRGQLKLIKAEDGFKTVRFEDEGEDVLVDYFVDGEILQFPTLNEIRERAALI